MKKQEFYYAMKICDIHNKLMDTNSNFYYKWKDADLIFIIYNEIKDSISIKILGEISYDFIVDFNKKYPNNTITISEVFDEKNKDNKYVSYVIIHNIKDILEFINEMKIYLAKKKEREELDNVSINEKLAKNDNSTNKEQDNDPNDISLKYHDIYEDPNVRRIIGEYRSQLPIRGNWAQSVRKHIKEEEKKRKERRKKMGRPLY